METPSTPPLEELLSHAHWARALARRIVRDEQRADDVVQEAWLAAVERPPRPEPGLRVWFARLVRNLAHNLRRAEQRRARHERGAAAPGPAPASSAPIVDELAAQQLVAQALLALDEPYRETLIRRWYRDEKPAAIARAMQVPVKTVDTRLARGLEKLRAELTARRGGSSRDWCLLLAPLAQAGTATGVVAAWTGGAITMAGLAKLAAAVVVAAAAVATWKTIAAPRTEVAMGLPVPALAVARGSESAPAQSAGATRSEETPAVPAASPAAVDPLPEFRGTGHLRGRVVDETSGESIAGCAVKAWWGNGIDLAPPWLVEATTDANGEFELEQLGSMIGVSLCADGHVKHYENFRDPDLHDDRAAAPRLFRLEPRTYGTLVVRLRARDGQPLPRSIEEGATVAYGPNWPVPQNNDRFEGLPQIPSDGTTVEIMLPAERHGDSFRIDRAPARTDIRLTASVGHDVLNSVRLEPLAPGETREIPFAIDRGIVVPIRCIDAGTGERVDPKGRGTYPRPTLQWTGARPRDHALRSIEAEVLDGALVLPAPGRIAIEGSLEGFAPFRVAAAVTDGTPLEIPLSRWRRLRVQVRDAHGEPWKRRFVAPRNDGSTQPAGPGFLVAGRAPRCVVVAANAPLPAALDPDAPLAAKLLPRIVNLAVEYEGFVPMAPLRVGIYDDGRLVGSTDVPETAPLLVEEPSSRSAGKMGASVLDSSSRASGDPKEPTQAVTVDVTLRPAAEGSLRFRAIGEDERPLARFEASFQPIVGGEPGDYGHATFRVDDPGRGLFSLDAIPAGDWRLRLRLRPANVDAFDAWVGDITIEAGRTTDLGALRFGVPGKVQVHVIDENGSPAVDAEIHVATADGTRPIEFNVVKGNSHQTSVRTTARRADLELELASGKVRVEVNSGGYAPAFADVEVPANGTATCTITLKETDPASAPREPGKH